MFSGLRNYFSGRNYDHPDYASQQSWPTRHKVSNWLSGINKSSRHKDPYWNKGYEDDSRYYPSQRHHQRESSNHPHQSGSRMRQRHNSMPNMRTAPHHSLPPMKDERPRQSAMYGNHHQPMYPYQQRSHNEYSMIPQYHSKHYEPQSQYMNHQQYQSPLRQSYHGPSGYNNNGNYNGSHLNRYSSMGGGGGGGGYNQYNGQMNPYAHPQQSLQQQHHHGYNTNPYQRQHYPSNYM